jgi:hypothetical protein
MVNHLISKDFITGNWFNFNDRRKSGFQKQRRFIAAFRVKIPMTPSFLQHCSALSSRQSDRVPSHSAAPYLTTASIHM